MPPSAAVPDIAHLTGVRFGPRSFSLSRDRVKNFIRATGDSSIRWTKTAPPGIVAGSLFTVAGRMLEELSEWTIIHSDQSFTWHQPLPVGSEYEVVGVAERVRTRAELTFVTFALEMTHPQTGLVSSGSSTFIISQPDLTQDSTEPSTSTENTKPAQLAAPQAKGEHDPINDLPVPTNGHSFGPCRRSISRSELLLYAAATDDWNPIHWDLASACAGGFDTIIGHGLLQLAWLLQPFSTPFPAGIDCPIGSVRVRFRSPLLVASTVLLSGEYHQDGGKAWLHQSDSSLEEDGDTPTVVASAQIETAASV